MENSTEIKTVNTEIPNANLIPCKTCGNQMAKTAKKCPSCGAKNKSKSKKSLIVFGAIILAIAIIFGGKSIVNTIKENNIEFQPGNARAMLTEHRANEAAANAKYSGEAYYFIGIIDTISSSTMDVCVDGNLTVMGALHSFGGEKLDVDISELKNADYFYENVKEGDTVLIKGVFEKMWNGHIYLDGYYVELYEGEYDYTYLNVR